MPKSNHRIPFVDTKGRPVSGYSVYAGNGKFYYRKTFKKLKLPALDFCTEQTTFGRAKTAVEIAIQRHKNKHLGIVDDHVFGQRSGKLVREVVKDILEKVTPKKRKKTRAAHKFYFSRITEHFGERTLLSITLDDFDKWVSDLREAETKRTKGRRRETFVDYAKHMNKLMRYAYLRKYVTHLLEFESPDGPAKTRKRVYTPQEISAIWKNSEKLKYRAIRESFRDQFVLSYECFMRLHEVLYLRWEWVNQRTGEIQLPKEAVKTGNQTGDGRSFIVGEKSLQMLKRRQKHSRSPFVFPSRFNPYIPQEENRSAWVTVKKLSGITGEATWHSLRHTALTRAIENGADIVKLSKYCGTSIATLDKNYLHLQAKKTKEINSVVSIFEKKV